MSKSSQPSPGRDYWRSLEEYANTADFRDLIEREFPSLLPDVVDPASRRTFLKLMGASLALAGMTGCRWPEQKILPYSRRPEGRVPGVPSQYATAMEVAGVATGLLVTSYDGRPIKIEGNPDHPASLGASSAMAQASLLELYDPDRSRYPSRRQDGRLLNQSWEEFSRFADSHFSALREARGRGLAVLSESSSSPSVAAMRRRFLAAYPEARWYTYEPVSRANEYEGTSLAFGKPKRPQLSFEQADVIVCLDADPLMTDPAAIRYAREFSSRRRAEDMTMSRLYAVESHYSVTGAQADHRYAVPSALIAAVSLALAHELYVRHGLVKRLPAGMARALEPPPADSLGFVADIAHDLIAHRGRSLILAGPRQPAEVHALVTSMNHVLGNSGATISYSDEPLAETGLSSTDFSELVGEIERGRVGTLVILGGNPIYNAPAEYELRSLIGKVGTSIHLSTYRDETSEVCDWHLNRAHFLETWGDVRAWDGTLSVAQPLIEPLFGGKSVIELLALLAGEPASGYDIVRRSVGEIVAGADSEAGWRRLLHDGLASGSALERSVPSPNLAAIAERIASWRPPPIPRAPDQLEIVFVEDTRLFDGRFANSGWLQELPEPLTKLTWDNAVLISPATAKQLGLEHEQMVGLSLGERRVELPVFVMPGQASGSVSVWLGFGRTAAGRVGNGVGFDVYPLRRSAAAGFASGLRIEPTGRRFPLASTQTHWNMNPRATEETSRRVHQLIREATLEHYQQHPDFAQHVTHTPHLESLFGEHDYEGYKWGMAIDLTVCTGCSACVVACQAENNVPVVGKEEVRRGREMHWLRIDRYFSGEPEQAQAAFQPVTCQHCENAPCEQVCPVAATVHSEEGLNQMVYNRC
ncbi:MAG: TAT-variant-translocated molybdopterin oxidoreductase, partial [Acidobacteriota bacterium]